MNVVPPHPRTHNTSLHWLKAVNMHWNCSALLLYNWSSVFYLSLVLIWQRITC